MVTKGKSMQKQHLLITGSPGCGKTTLLIRLADHFSDFRPAGFYTEEIRKDGVRQGFRLRSLDGREGLLSHVRLKKGPRVGRYCVDVAGFNAFLSEQDLARSAAPLVLIDEIGKMECLSSVFVEMMRDLFISEKMVIATIAARGQGFIQEVKERKDCELVAISPHTRESRFEEVARRIRDRLE
jgi:nucleoside-triphosphatase